MAFGVTENGFVLKRLDDIKQDLEDDFRELFGEIDVSADAVFGQIIGVMSRHLAEIWEQGENVYYSQYPASANGLSLDGTSQLTGIIRLSSTETEVVAQLEGTANTIVPADNKASQSTTGNLFEQTILTMISELSAHRIITTIDNDVDATYSLLISGTLVSYIAVSKTKAEIAEGLSSAINAEPLLSTLVLSSYTIGDEFLTIDIVPAIDPISLLQLPLTVDRVFSVVVIADTTITGIWTPSLYRALLTGAIVAPTESIDTIENPVSGLNTITNFEGGVTGRDPESDVELRTRRAESLQILGAGTIGAIKSRILQEVDNVTQAKVIENRTDNWIPLGSDPTGRPPHSFEAIVQGGDSTEIAEKIWEVKSAGIETDGNTQVIITDSNGDLQTIEFSRPVAIYTFVRVDYDKTDSEGIFPGDGEDTIRDNIYNLGVTHDIGEDVLLQRFYSPVYAVPGVTAVTLFLATSVDPADLAPSWVSTNITIDSDQFAEFINNSIRIVINDVTP